jgi:uncharacterized membrane protein YhiD involved in acid resistance
MRAKEKIERTFKPEIPNDVINTCQELLNELDNDMTTLVGLSPALALSHWFRTGIGLLCCFEDMKQAGMMTVETTKFILECLKEGVEELQDNPERQKQLAEKIMKKNEEVLKRLAKEENNVSH